MKLANVRRTMTDKQIIIDKLKNEIACKENIINHLAEYNIKLENQLKAKDQECEELKRLISKQKNAKIQLSKLKDKQYKEFCDMKQTLTEIKEIAEECYYKCNSMNNCNISCKYYNNCNGEFSYLLAYLNKQISEVEK